MRALFEDRGKIYAIFQMFDKHGSVPWWLWVGRLQGGQWEEVPFPCIPNGRVWRVVSDQQRWWYVAGGFVMPDGGKAVMRVDPVSLEWENLAQEVVKGDGMMWHIPQVWDLAQDSAYVYAGVERLQYAGGVPGGVIARWHKQRQRWEPFYDGCGHLLDGKATYALVVDDEAVYAGGEQLAIYGESQDWGEGVLFQFSKQQRRWRRLGTVAEAGMEAVRRLVKWQQRLYVVGKVRERSDGVKETAVRVYDLLQQRWQDFAGLDAAAGGFRCYALAATDEGVYFGGEFRIVLPDGDTVRNFALWDGQQWQRVGPQGTRIEGRVSVIYVTEEGVGIFGKLVVHTVDGEAIRNAALWDGQQWRAIEGMTDAVAGRQRLELDAVLSLPDYGWWIFGGADVEVVSSTGVAKIGLLAVGEMPFLIPPFQRGKLNAILRVDNEVWLGGGYRYVVVPQGSGVRYYGVSYGVVRWQLPEVVSSVAVEAKAAGVRCVQMGEQLRVEVQRGKVAVVKLYNLRGQQVAQLEGRGAVFEIEVPAKGMYFCRVQWADGRVAVVPVLIR